MKKLYIFLLALLSISLVGIAQQRNSLKNHPIIGIWDLDRFEVSVSSENKAFEDQLNQIIKESETKFMSGLAGAYMVFTEQGTHILIEQRTDLTEFVVNEVVLSHYSIFDSLITIEGQRGGMKESLRYDISDDYLYLIMEREEAREMLEDSEELDAVEDADSVDYTVDARVRLKKSARQLTSLNEHSITIGTWLCEEVVYDVDVDTDREEEYAKVITLFEESFQDKIAFWNKMLRFGSDGILYDLTEPQNEDSLYQMYYFIEDDRSITAISSDNTIYSADFQLEDDTLVLIISHLEGDFEVYASLEKEKLPPVKKAAIKIKYRLMK